MKMNNQLLFFCFLMASGNSIYTADPLKNLGILQNLLNKDLPVQPGMLVHDPLEQVGNNILDYDMDEEEEDDEQEDENIVLDCERRVLQHLFDKHAHDFGFTGRWNTRNGNKFKQVLIDHVNSVDCIVGTYRKLMPVFHYLDPNTGLNVMTDLEGALIGGWRLSEEQLECLFSDGNVQ